MVGVRRSPSCSPNPKTTRNRASPTTPKSASAAIGRFCTPQGCSGDGNAIAGWPGEAIAGRLEMRAECELVVRGLEPGSDEWMVEEDPQPDVAEQRPLGVALDLTRGIDLVDPEKLGEPFDRVTTRRRCSRTDGEHDGEEREQLALAGAVPGDPDHGEQTRGEPEPENAGHRSRQSCPEPAGNACGDHPASTDEPLAGDHRHERDRQDARREGREVVRPDERGLALCRTAAAELVDHTCELQDRPGGCGDAGCHEHRDEEPSLAMGSKEQRERRERGGRTRRIPLRRRASSSTRRARRAAPGERPTRGREGREQPPRPRRRFDGTSGPKPSRRPTTIAATTIARMAASASEASMLVPPASSERFGW